MKKLLVKKDTVKSKLVHEPGTEPIDETRPYIVFRRTVGKGQIPKTRRNRVTGERELTSPGEVTGHWVCYLADHRSKSPYIWATPEWITAKVSSPDFTPVAFGGLPEDYDEGWKSQISKCFGIIRGAVEAEKRILAMESKNAKTE